MQGINKVERALADLWIELHPSSPICAWLMSNHYFYHRIEKQAEIFPLLKPAAKNNRPGKDLELNVSRFLANSEGRPAPAIALPDTSGNMESLESFRGKYVLLDFWASWCMPCREESPYLREALKKFGHKNFTILSVSLDTKKNLWLKAIEKDQLHWTHISDLQSRPDNNTLSGYYIPTIPANFLINPEGVIIARDLRGEAVGKKLAEVLGCE